MILLSEWTAIAIRPYPGATFPPSRRRNAPSNHGPRWRSMPDAPLSYAEAKRLVADGMLLAANRITDYGTEFVVKSTRLALQQACRAA